MTPEQELEFSQFKDPDAPLESQYKWDEEFQKRIIALLMSDRYFLIQSVGLVKSEYFTNEIHRAICKILFNHFDKYKGVLPNKFQITEELRIVTLERKPEIKLQFFGELSALYDYYVPGLDTRDYLLDKITVFAKHEAIKKAFRTSLEIMKRSPESDDTSVKVYEIIKEAMMVERNFDIGLDYFQTAEERHERMKQKIAKGEIFTTGFQSIDNALNGGIGRGEIGSWVGLSGTGKSLVLKSAAIANLNLGKRVLYVSTEMDQDAVAGRFDLELADPASIFNVNPSNLYEKSDIICRALAEFANDQEDKRLLVIKQFPSGQMDVPMFRAYYNQVLLHGFKPDLVILDYVGEMKDYPNMPTHESRYRIVRDLRGFAVEEQVGFMTAMQPNKTAKEAIKLGDVIDDENLGDSFAQSRPLDCLWSINQTNDEKNCFLGRIFVAKHRNGKSKFYFPVNYDQNTLRISEISSTKYKERYKKYMHSKQEKATESISKKDEEKAMQIVGGSWESDNSDVS